MIEREGGVMLYFEFPLTPRFFLDSAKKDLAGKDTKGLVNALTNSKRAIDCQTDTFLNSIGYTSKGLEKQLNTAAIQSVNTYSNTPSLPLKFKVLESLGIVTPAIVDKVRQIRHNLEHEYRKPTARVVREAIDIASLFVSACEGAMNVFLHDVYFVKGRTAHPLFDEEVSATSVIIGFNDNPKARINVRFRNFSPWEVAEVTIPPTDPQYLALLRVLFSVRLEENIERDIILAATTSGFSLSGKKVKVKSIEYG